MEKKRQIRNSNGKLLCEIEFRDGIWSVIIKNHDCVTVLDLDFHGSANYLSYTHIK